MFNSVTFCDSATTKQQLAQSPFLWADEQLDTITHAEGHGY